MTGNPEFSWVRAIGEARAGAPSTMAAGLREHLRRHPLRGFELEMLGRFLRDAVVVGSPCFPALRVAIVSGNTTEPLANAMRVALLAEGFRAQVYEAPFAAYRQEILSPGSGLYAFDPELILLAAPADDISCMPAPNSSRRDVQSEMDREVEQWSWLWAQLGARSKAVILQHTLEAPETAFLGVAEKRVCWSPEIFIRELNERLIAEAPGSVRWVDVDSLANSIGRRNWNDPRLKHHGKLGFSSKFLPEYATLLWGVLRSSLGRARKALILDLDNTLWGGVIGDDGLEGIRIGPDTPEGEAYQSFCRYLSDLGRRGVILGICSKNEMANVTEVFERHPHMPLNLDQFSAIRCNWEDKASNLVSIAGELNIDVSSLVFADDNPAECELVRQALPAVHVIPLDGDPAVFVRCIDEQRLFESQLLSNEDLARAQSYRARAHAASIQASSLDIGSYLRSLDMFAEVRRAVSSDIARIEQMELKTNQFNLSTRRLSREKIEAVMNCPNNMVLVASLEDKFANHGMVAYLVAEVSGDKELTISDWIMSCRVFSRTLEQFLFFQVIQQAELLRLEEITLRYARTEKNQVLLNSLPSLGLVCQGPAPEGPWVYRLGVGPKPATYIQEKPNPPAS